MDIIAKYATLSHEKESPVMYSAAIGSVRNMFGATESTIPSVLVTKENLITPKQRHKQSKDVSYDWMNEEKNRNTFVILEKSRSQQSRNNDEEAPRRIATQGSSLAFLPDIVTAPPRTAGVIFNKPPPSQDRVNHSELSNYRKISKNSNIQLPKFRKGLALHTSYPEQEPIIRNIKFWRGTTPLSRSGNYQVTAKTLQDKPVPDNKTATENNETSNMIAQEEVTINTPQQPRWSSRFPLKDETREAQNKFYARHMALRDRLIEFETMHYREAVTRINRYREKLRRPLATRAGIGMTRQGRVRVNDTRQHQQSKQLLARQPQKTSATAKKEESEVTNLSPPGVRMSPSKEWKPYILKSQKAGQPTRPPFFDKSAEKNDRPQVKTFQQMKKRISPRSQQTTAAKQLRSMNPSPERGVNYPIHGEKLLRGNTPQKKQDVSEGSQQVNKTGNENVKDHGLPTIEGVKEFGKQGNVTLDTQQILVDIRKQLNVSKENVTNGTKHSWSENQTVENDAERLSSSNNLARTSMGSKLRILLQKSSQSERNKENEQTKTDEAPVKTHGQKYVQRSSRFYPPGEARFPNVTKIGNIATTREEEKFTRTGTQKNSRVDNETNSKEIKHPGNHMKSDLDKEDPYRDVTASLNIKNVYKPSPITKVSFGEHQQVLGSKMALTNTEKNAQDLSTEEDVRSHAYRTYWRKKIAARKLNTAGSILQNTSGLSGNATRDTDQTELKLITNPVSVQRGKPGDQEHIGMEGRKKQGGKQKVLRIAVVEPPNTVNETTKRNKFLQQQRDQLNQSRQMPFDPANLAITSFTAAILHSELALRAPSSSPVDFLKTFHQKLGTKLRKQDNNFPFYINNSRQESPLDGTIIKPQTPLHERVGMPMNKKDGLSPPLTGFTEVHRDHRPGLAPPKVSDLIDLQRLYDVMRKQGGYLPFQIPSTFGCVQQLNKQHTDKAQLRKQPFYHYPYSNQENLQEKHGLSVPLYVVTGVKSMPSTEKTGKMTGQKHAHMNPTTLQLNAKRAKQNYQQYQRITTKAEKESRVNVVYHSPFYEQENQNHRYTDPELTPSQYQGYNGIRGVTVSTMRPPVTSAHLEQIKEQVLD